MATDAIGSDAVHIPVMRARILDLLAVVLKSGRRVHVDGTLGMGGHAEAVLRRFPDVELVGIDRDQQALTMAEARLEPFADRVHLVHAVHDELPEVLDDLGLDYVDSVLLDLGLSSFQIDEVERGFSYSVDSPLDMRMDQSSGRTAAQILNESDPGALVRMLREYGEEKFADRIVRAIVTERDRQPIETSGRLVEIITEAIPATVRRKRHSHPAKRTFQALRIAVNREMETLPAVLPRALDRLDVGGRIAVLSYHSWRTAPSRRPSATHARIQPQPDCRWSPSQWQQSSTLLLGGRNVPTPMRWPPIHDPPRHGCGSLSGFDLGPLTVSMRPRRADER